VSAPGARGGGGASNAGGRAAAKPGPRRAARSAQATSSGPSGRRSTLSAWDDGWLRAARHAASPNHDARPSGIAVDLVVVHSISLPPGVYGGGAIEDLFLNRLDWDAHPYYAGIRGLRVSSHFLVRRDGGLLQFVSCDERAWHAGRSTWRGREACNDYSIGVELEGLEGERFEEAQYAALGTLLQPLARRYPITAIAGHEHVAPGRKHDPGPGFEWGRLEAVLAGPARYLRSALAGLAR
jgi:AmpD protein